MVTIRQLTSADIPFAVSLTDFENWGNQDIDFKRYATLFPKGNFLAEIQGQSVGIITTATFGSFGFMGNLIVLKSTRGLGAGRQLMEKALEHLKSLGCTTIELDGDYPAVKFYRKLGFKDKYLSLRFLKEAKSSSPPSKTSDITDIKKALALDSKLTELKRLDYIESILKDYPDQASHRKGDNLSGYGVIKPRANDSYLLGPVLARDSKSAMEIIRALTEKYSDKDIKSGVGEDNREAVGIYRDLGYVYTPPSLRMYFGKRIDYEKHIYAIVSGDVG